MTCHVCGADHGRRVDAPRPLLGPDARLRSLVRLRRTSRHHASRGSCVVHADPSLSLNPGRGVRSGFRACSCDEMTSMYA